MLVNGLLFLGGIAGCAALPALPGPWWALGLAPLAYLAWRRRGWRCPALFACGFCWALLNAHLVLRHQLLPQDEGRTLYAEGRIISLPQVKDAACRFNFQLERLQYRGQDVKSNPGRVRLGWYRNCRLPQPGERWRLKIRMKRPYGFMNPGGFDYESWLFQHRLRATGYVVNDAGNARLAAASLWSVDALRFAIKNKIRETASDNPLAGFIPALAIGDRDGISAAQWQVLTATGTNHLVAISGLHIGLVAGLAYLLFLKAWNWTLAPLVAVAAPRLAAVVAMAAAFGYALLAGFSLPTQRALIMLCVYFTMQLRDRRPRPGNVLGLALLAVLLFDPFASLAPGFWLSFAAVASILYSVAWRPQRGNRRRQWGRVQYVVSLGLAPALAFYYQQLPVFSVAANLLAVPWVSFTVVPLALAGSGLLFVHEGAAGLLLEPALWSLDVFWRFLQLFMVEGVHSLPVPRPGAAALAAAAAGVLLLLLPAGAAPRRLGLVWLLPMFLPHQSQLPPGQFSLVALDVGQGLAVVVRTARHTLLYDSGPSFPSGFNAGAAVVTPFLRSAGVAGIDMLVQSHGDNDHSGGLAGVIDAVPIEQIISSAPERAPPGRAQYCRAGQSWRWDGVRFDVLHPVPEEDLGLDSNNGSCVLRVSGRDYTLLLPGDIERTAERRLLERYGAAGLRAQVLVAPHHGSATSSTPGFIAAVAPDIVVFPVGYRNRFKLPDQAVAARYRQRRAKLLSTAEDGAIEIVAAAAGLEITRYRKERRSFRHTVAAPPPGAR